MERSSLLYVGTPARPIKYVAIVRYEFALGFGIGC